MNKFEVGDLVFLVSNRAILGQSKAFRDRAIGPFRVLGLFNDDLNYTL